MAVDLIGVCEEFVNGLDGLPGVKLPPPATQEQILAAQDSLGVRWPSDLALLALLSDGLSIDYGQEHMLTFAPDTPLDVVTFNDPTTWQWAYTDFHPQVHDFLYVAVHWTGNLVGYRRDELDKVPEVLPRTYVVVPRAPGGIFPAPKSILDGLQGRTQRLRQTGQLHMDSDDLQVLDMHGPLPSGTIVMPGPSNLLNDDGSLEGSMVMDAVSALIAMGELIGQLRELPDGTRATGMEPWTDELGRTRLRWQIAP